MIRLNKFLAINLEISRRAADELISNGLVIVNSQVGHVGQKIRTKKDIVYYNGKKVDCVKKIYYILYKPKGYICSRSKQGKSPTIYDLIDYKNLKYAGRLDKDSEGLLLLSNDGDWIYGLTHPKFEVEKIYIVNTNSEIDLKKFISIYEKDRFIYKLNKISRVGVQEYKVVLTTGKKREIREIFQYNDIGITKLKRIQMGNYMLGEMKPGELREIEGYVQ